MDADIIGRESSFSMCCVAIASTVGQPLSLWQLLLASKVIDYSCKIDFLLQTISTGNAYEMLHRTAKHCIMLSQIER